MVLSSESDPCGEIDDALKAKPNRLDARLAVPLSCQEAAQHRYQSHDLVECAGIGKATALMKGLGRQHLRAAPIPSKLAGRD